MSGILQAAETSMKQVTTIPGGETTEIGELVFSIPGTYLWTCPDNVYSVSVVCVGGGGGATGGGYEYAGGGAGLGWKNNITVVPGQGYVVVVGSGGIAATGLSIYNATSGSDSYFLSPSVVSGRGGAAGNKNSGGTGGSYTGDGGGMGGSGGYQGGGGGGAGGYTGAGGKGGDKATSTVNGYGSNGSGGGGGGGGGGISSAAGGGGGTGLYGIGINGEGGFSVYGTTIAGWPGLGGSMGSAGSGVSNNKGGCIITLLGNTRATGGFPGGGGGGAHQTVVGTTCMGNGANGAVRIMWGGNRTFPNNAGNVVPTTVVGEQSYITAGVYTFIVPEEVYGVSVLCIGGGAAGTTSTSLSADGKDSSFGTFCSAGGGQSQRYSNKNGNGKGGFPIICDNGYKGGDGAQYVTNNTFIGAQGGPGGGGGGSCQLNFTRYCSGGGGVGLGNTGTSGLAGAIRLPATYSFLGTDGTNGGGGGGSSWYTANQLPDGTIFAYGGGGGSGGGAGGNSVKKASTYDGGVGGLYGGAGGGASNSIQGAGGGAKCWTNNIVVKPGQQILVTVGSGGTPTNLGGAGGVGAVRIIWGPNRSFPSNSE